MILERLRIQDFRNISQATLTLSAGLNVLAGGNGQGKTNLLEAIGLLASGRSFRRTPPSAMRRHGQAGFYLSAEVHSKKLTHRLEFTTLGQQQAVRLNGKAMTTVSSMGQTLAVVVLTPDAPELIRGTPGERRDYLDWVIFCHDRSHAATARDYQSVLKTRNHLLRTQCQDARQFDAWEARLAILGTHITLKRRRLMRHMGERLRPFLQAMDLDPEAYVWQLKCQLDRFPELASEAKPSETAIETQYRTLLVQSRTVDQRTGSTSIGPHRDDPSFLQKGRPLARFASRGQQKRFLLALKLVEADLLKERLGEAPLLLLDDPSAELDQEAIPRLMNLLASGENQLFLATCAAEAISWPSARPVTLFKVAEGAFEPTEALT